MFSESIALPTAVVAAAQCIVAVAMALCLLRIVVGPSVADRIVALDLFSALIMAQLVLLVFNTGFTAYLDAAAAIAIISFLATVAFARYLENARGPLRGQEETEPPGHGPMETVE